MVTGKKTRAWYRYKEEVCDATEASSAIRCRIHKSFFPAKVIKDEFCNYFNKTTTKNR
jgi:hypothetical protein